MGVAAAFGTGAPGPAPRREFGGAGEPGHLVQFYEADAFLADAVTRFIGVGVDAGEGSVVIATKPHLDGIEERLRLRGLDIATAREQGRYVALDAAETLSRVMDDGWPGETRFVEVMGQVIAGAAGDRGLPVRVFGEIVALLWTQGNRRAAVRLEALWNVLAGMEAFSLLCGYPMRGFARAADGKSFLEICAEHSRVLPAEGYAELPDSDERLRSITWLQQKARALEGEIAERKELEKRLRQREQQLADLLVQERAARAEAERLASAKDDFLATLSHELRTPLTAMLGWVRMLRGEQLDGASVAYALEVLERSAQAQARLIEDLLDVSRIVSGRLSLDIRQVDLGALIDAVTETMRPAAQAKAIRLERAPGPPVGPIAGDPDRLQQVVWNLLANGVKYTPSGGRVEVGLRRARSTVQITVKDTGIGIRADFLPRLFERFSQADGGPSRAKGGLGLGLAIVRHLVELHGGSVRAESPGERLGATFTVSLPVPEIDASRAGRSGPPP